MEEHRYFRITVTMLLEKIRTETTVNKVPFNLDDHHADISATTTV